MSLDAALIQLLSSLAHQADLRDIVFKGPLQLNKGMHRSCFTYKDIRSRSGVFIQTTYGDIELAIQSDNIQITLFSVHLITPCSSDQRLAIEQPLSDQPLPTRIFVKKELNIDILKQDVAREILGLFSSYPALILESLNSHCTRDKRWYYYRKR